jgi:hypothetical protein
VFAYILPINTYSFYNDRSAMAKNRASTLFAQITSMKIHSTRWNGTTRNFVLQWVNKIREYHHLSDSSNHNISDPMKKTILVNMVKSDPKFYYKEYIHSSRLSNRKRIQVLRVVKRMLSENITQMGRTHTQRAQQEASGRKFLSKILGKTFPIISPHHAIP